MLKDLCPRAHTRLTSLPLLGPHAEEFAGWLQLQGYPPKPIRLRLRALHRVDELLRRRGVLRVEDLTASDILRLAPGDLQVDINLAAVVRSIARFLSAHGQLARQPATPQEELVAAYSNELDRLRGLARSTRTHHVATASELLAFVGYQGDTACLRALRGPDMDAFLRRVGPRLSRASLQHTVGHVRAFLRFLAARRLVAAGLDSQIDTPRLYRGERLPRSLPWAVVRALLTAIDRSTPMGTRDYAMFLLIATYGLRTCEVTSLRLDDIHWRTRRLNVPRSKTGAPLVLPLTEEVGAALIGYLRGARPDLPCREVFLRVRAPAGRLRPTAVTEAFQGWVRRSGLPIPYQGPHCLRHSLAVHLLREGTPLKTIGGILGHRSVESTCVYLRLHVEDLRGVSLDLPQEVQP